MGTINENSENDNLPINKDFLETLLDEEVESFTIGKGSNLGDNYMSVIHSAHVLLKGSSQPKYILLKCYPNLAARREFLDQSDIFGKELFMYDSLLPEYIKIAEKDTENRIQLAVPQFLGGNDKNRQGQLVKQCITITIQASKFPEPWTKENFIAMIDLRKTQGFQMANRISGLDFNHVKLVMKELATFHALSWCYKQEHHCESLNKRFPDVLPDRMFSEMFQNQFKPMMDALIGEALTLVEEKVGDKSPIYLGTKRFFSRDHIEILSKFIQPEGIRESEVELFLRVPSPKPLEPVPDLWSVGCHGDCWVNNILFKYDEKDGRPLQTVLLDLQLYKEGCLTTDLAYFFYTSTTLETRTLHEDAFLQTYMESFHFTCTTLGYNTLPGLNLETLKRRYRQTKLLGLTMALPVLTIVLKPAEQVLDMDLLEGDMAEVFSQAMEGKGSNILYRNRIIDIIEELYDDGIL